jgi:hypothetical protein
MTPPGSFAVIGNGAGVAEAIARLLVTAHGWTEVGEGPVDAVLIDTVDDEEAIEFDRLTDADLARLYVEPTVRLEQAAHQAVLRLKEPGALLFVGTDAYLGRPSGAAQSAASGSMVLLARSLPLWKPSIRSNVLVLPSARVRRDEPTIADAAGMAAVLLTAASVNGETISIAGGAHLQPPPRPVL